MVEYSLSSQAQGLYGVRVCQDLLNGITKIFAFYYIYFNKKEEKKKKEK